MGAPLAGITTLVRAVTTWKRLVFDTLRLAAGTPRLSDGSCQCLITIHSVFFLESRFGSVVGNTIETDLTDLVSGAASFVYETSILSAFVDGSLWSFVPVVTLSDDNATVSVNEVSLGISSFANGTPRETSAVA
jgi:hypothetical protein